MLESLNMYHILTEADFTDKGANAIVEAIKLYNDSLKEPLDRLATKEDVHLLKSDINILAQHISFVEKMLYGLGAIMLAGFSLLVYLIQK